jgi:serine/threonine-protein kinase
MELLEGENLTKYTARNNLLPIETVKEYIIKIAEAIDYAHKMGVIHQDIKPANILLLKNGSLRVTDFGMTLVAASSQTRTGTAPGLPSYLSPEQLAGKKIDGRSDFFSLGVLFFELLSGIKPFDGDNGAVVSYKITNEQHPDLSALRPEVPAHLVTIVDTMLAKDPAQRYQKGAELVKDLRNAP